MENVTYEILDTGNENNLCEYEQGLYQAFSNDNLLAEKYQIIGNSRLRPCIPYHDLKVFTAKYNSKIIAAVTINTNIERLQMEKVGFDKPDGSDYYEGLGLFLLSSEKINTFNLFVSLYNNLMLPYLSKKNISFIYSTCNQQLLAMYEMADWTPVKSIDWNGQTKYLIKLEVKGKSS